MRKPVFCIYKNKDADQLHGNREADQCLCFRYIKCTISLLSKSEISSLQPSSLTTARFVSDQVGNQNVGFLMTQLINALSDQGLCYMLPRLYELCREKTCLWGF